MNIPEMTPRDKTLVDAAVSRVTKGNPEIGRALKATELAERTVVIVVPPPYILAMSLWVISVDIGAGILVCHAGVLNNTIISMFDDAGNVFDDRGLPVFYFEYKGEV